MLGRAKQADGVVRAVQPSMRGRVSLPLLAGEKERMKSLRFINLLLKLFPTVTQPLTLPQPLPLPSYWWSDVSLARERAREHELAS